jgi:hypothetical protein
MEPIEQYLKKVEVAREAQDRVNKLFARLLAETGRLQKNWKSQLWPGRGGISMNHAAKIGATSQTPLPPWPTLELVTESVNAYSEAVRQAEAALEAVPMRDRGQLPQPPY